LANILTTKYIQFRSESEWINCYWKIFGKEKYMGLNEKDSIALIAEKIKSN